MSREIDKNSLVVNDGDIVIVSNTPTKKGGIFAEVGVSPLVGSDALVALRPEVSGKVKRGSLTGKLLPNLSPTNSALLTGGETEFVEGKSISVTLPNNLDRLRRFLGKKLLGL